MKKKIKALIIATSVAAIAGIGAVSFAAWSAGNVGQETANGATGNVTTTAGSIVVSGNNINTASGSEVLLLPWDQKVQMGNNVTMQTFKVKYDAGTNGADVESYTYKMSLANASNLTLYYHIGADVTKAGDPTEGSDWTLFADEVELDLKSGEQTVNIIMASAVEEDMDKSYSITISAAPVGA